MSWAIPLAMLAARRPWTASQKAVDARHVDLIFETLTHTHCLQLRQAGTGELGAAPNNGTWRCARPISRSTPCRLGHKSIEITSGETFEIEVDGELTSTLMGFLAFFRAARGRRGHKVQEDPSAVTVCEIAVCGERLAGVRP
jgi:hypothetical protein